VKMLRTGRVICGGAPVCGIFPNSPCGVGGGAGEEIPAVVGVPGENGLLTDGPREVCGVGVLDGFPNSGEGTGGCEISIGVGPNNEPWRWLPEACEILGALLGALDPKGDGGRSVPVACEILGALLGALDPKGDGGRSVPVACEILGALDPRGVEGTIPPAACES
jgi:hypothetical protein